MKSFDLAGRVTLVTGGSRGLGQAICRGFAEHGSAVVVASRKEGACIDLADALRRDYGADALGVGCDVGHWNDCERLVDVVYERFGRLDVLVNNAGMSPLYDALSDVTEALFDKVISVNLKGPFRLSALVAERMKAAGSGSIINISSIAAVAPSSREVPYAVAKAGLNNLTIGLAHSCGPYVRVNAIMPGPFLTDVSKSWDMEAFTRTAKRTIPLQRAGEANEIVGAVLYLASDAASYTTGAIIKVDGGVAFTPG